MSNIVCLNVNIANLKKSRKVNRTQYICPGGESITSSRQCNGVNGCAENTDEATCFRKGSRFMLFVN